MNFDKKPEGWIEDKNEARVAASAEKPVRDLAREEGVDPETKAVFDKRAAQKGEEALAALRKKIESQLGLVNPELQQLRSEIAEIKEQIKQEFGEKVKENYTVVPELSHWKKDADGLKSIQIRSLYSYDSRQKKLMPMGSLGRKFEDIYKAMIDDRGDLLQKDGGEEFFKQMIEACKYDPEAKTLVNRFVDLNEKAHIKKLEIQKIHDQKRENYHSAENINSFLERIGHTKRVPPGYNSNTILNGLRDADREKNKEKFAELANTVLWAAKAISSVNLAPERIEDVQDDFGIIQSELNGLADRIQYSSDNIYPPESKEIFVRQWKDLYK